MPAHNQTEDPKFDRSEDQVIVDRPEQHVGRIVLNNPPRNQLSYEGRRQFVEALRTFDADDDIRCLVIGATGTAFTAGNDLRQDDEMSDDDLAEFFDGFDEVLAGMENFRAPVIAAINGAAVGGGLEFALCCDIRIASDEASFIAAGVNVGLIASFYRLPRIVGEGPAKDLLLTGRNWNAEEALRWGLVSAVHPRETLMDEALAVAHRIATRAPLSVEATKDAVRRVRHMNAAEARQLQLDRFTEMFRTDDHREAVRAFFERRDGVYTRS